MKKKESINGLNKVLKSRSNKITPASKKVIREVIRELESRNTNWDKVIMRLAKLAAIISSISKIFKQ